MVQGSSLNTAALALGAAVTVVPITVLWKSATLRGDLAQKWDERVAIAEAGLDELAVAVLRRLQIEANNLLGDPEAGSVSDPTESFSPDMAVADPALLERFTTRFHKVLVARKRLQQRYAALLFIAKISPIIAGMYVVGAAVSTAYFGGLMQVRNLGLAGLALAGLAAFLGALILVAFVYLNWRLATAEQMSKQDPFGQRRA